MINFSLTEKLVQLKDIIVSSPFFFVSLFVGIALLVIMIIGIKKKRRINKIIFIISWFFVLVFCMVKYYKSMLGILDRLFGRIVEEIYFPSITVYTFMLLFTNIVFIYSILKKKIDNAYKIINLALPMLIDFLLILTLDVIVKSNIDIYEKLTAFSNEKLLVLIEFSMMIFLLWIFLLGIITLIKKYAVKKVFVSTFKEEDYEVIDNDLENNNSKDIDVDIDKIDLDDDMEANSNNTNDSVEIVDL